jgi:hypothetical protein
LFFYELDEAKRMIKKVAVIALVIVASLSVAGCTVGPTSSPTPTPTPAPTISTPTPQADYSTVFNKEWQAIGFFLDTPFTKSTNIRGNDVYMGSARNTSLPGQKGVTVVEELTKSEAEAKQLFDKYVSNKLNEGYTPYPKEVAGWPYKAAWFGATDPYYTHQFYAMYRYEGGVNSWAVTTQASN